MNSLLKITDLHVSVGETPILKGVNMEIRQGEIHALMGPNGSGKSTLFHQLGLIDNPTSGSLMVDGVDALRLTEKQKTGFRLKHIGYIFQDYALIPTLTAIENVVLPLLMAGVPHTEANAIAAKTLASVGLEGRGKHLPNELSGGQQQRVSIARALVHDPAIVLMDEPFGALDAMTRESMNLEILRIWKQSKKTILFVTHSIPEAVFLGERVVVMTPRPGRIAEIVTTNLPADRDLDAMSSPEFGQLTLHIRSHFNSRGIS